MPTARTSPTHSTHPARRRNGSGSLRWLLVIAFSTALLAGCTTRQTATDATGQQAPVASAPASADESLRQLTLLEASERDRTAVAWAGAYLQQGRIDAARQLLAVADDRRLDGDNLLRWAIIRAQLLLALPDSKAALALLAQPRVSAAEGATGEDSLRTRIALLRADSLTLDGDLLASLRERVSVNQLLPDEQQAYNQRMIWTQMMLLPRDTLADARSLTSSDALDGWLELAMIYRDPLADIDTQIRNLDGWQQRWPDHAAARNLPGMISGLRKAVRNRPRSVAVLLPMNGPMAPAAAAIRDGIMASYYSALNQGHPVPTLLFLDSSTSDVLALYNEATAAGAGMVIGPLDKQQAARLAQTSGLTVPTLALNYVDSANTDAKLFHFGLSPEDEARQVARQALLEGMQLAAVLHPDGDWGMRVANAFVSEFSAGGGVVTTLNDFGDDATASTRQLLNLGQSEARARQLRRYAPVAVEFEPRRRQDIDVVFMVANTEQARQLKPALNFHYASDLPVMATSHIYAGSPSPSRDSDLNGVRFVDIPWLLDGESELHRLANNVWPEGHGRFERLFALGVDAYRLHARLPLLQSMPDSFLPGVTGQLSMDADQNLVRKLQWAWFANGQPQRVPVVAGTGQAHKDDNASVIIPPAGD
jgi:hypothetical protein